MDIQEKIPQSLLRAHIKKVQILAFRVMQDGILACIAEEAVQSEHIRPYITVTLLKDARLQVVSMAERSVYCVAATVGSNRVFKDKGTVILSLWLVHNKRENSL